MSTPARLWRPLGVSFLNAEIKLCFLAGRAYVSVASICAALDLDVLAQHKRIAAWQNRKVLKARLLDEAGWCIPVEDASWFLRTLRCQHPRLAHYRTELPWFLVSAVVHYQGNFLPPKQQRELRLALPNTTQRLVERPRTRFTAADAQAMKAALRTGASLARIAAAFGCGKSTVFQIVNDKYTTLADEQAEGTSLNAECTALNALRSASDAGGVSVPPPNGKEPQMAPEEPSWLGVLRTACLASSQAKVARQIGYSAGAVSAVLAGYYAGNWENVANAVDAKLPVAKATALGQQG